MTRDHDVLEPLVRIPGVRAALLVAEDDGLVVSEASMTDVDTAAIAALSSSLWGKLRKTSVASGHRPPQLLQLRADHGALLVAGLERELLGVAVTGDTGNTGLVRLALLALQRDGVR